MSRAGLETLEDQGVDWTCGYTGHIPRLRDTFAKRNVVAAQLLKGSDAGPGSPGSPDSRPGSPERPMTQGSSRSGIFTGEVPRVEDVCGGQRRLVASPFLQYPGNGFCGTLLPARRVDRVSSEQVYEQGTRVNLSSYYRTCEARDYKVSHIQSGFAGKNKSNIKNGDDFYFSGKHMYETTQGESYSLADHKTKQKQNLSHHEQDQLVRERIRKYTVAKAVVGKTRVDSIIAKIKNGLEARVSGGSGFRRRMFVLFDKSGTGTVDPVDFRMVCNDLGVTITDLESVAVYGTADVNGDGAMSFHEFLASYMGEAAQGMDTGSPVAGVSAENSRSD